MSQYPTQPGSSPAKAIAIPVENVWKAKLSDYIELAKLRISVMVLATVVVGYLLGSRGEFNIIVLLHALWGVGLVAAASSMLNQVLERRTDALMPRTQNRPLPTGRVTSLETILFASVCGIYGTLHLMIFVNPLTAVLTLSTLIMYVAIYTPLKRCTSFCTTIGAIPGALPPVLGFAAAGHGLTLDAFWLFAVMFLWQFPHFLAIAWMYREQYAKAGLHMLPGQLPRKYVTGSMAVLYAIALLPVSLMPVYFGVAGPVYGDIAAAFGVAYLVYSIRFLRDETRQTARKLLFCSLFYLPVILTTLTISYLNT